MRVAWVSPLVARSAIGRVGVRVATELAARGVEVLLIGSEATRPEEPLHPTDLPVSYWRDLAPGELANEFDAVVVNVGDNYLFHAGAFDILAQAPCIGVFHDFYLHNLFNGWLADRGAEDPRLRVRTLVEVYGASGRELAESAARGQLGLAELAAHFPMTEWVGGMCAGALAHADFYRSRLEASCPGPVAMARMPVASREAPALGRRTRRGVRIVTVGVMNPNKCADRVIEALASSPLLSEIAEYRMVGPIEDAERARIEQLAISLGFRRLTLTGPVDDPQLEAELAAADVICCLRHPVLEGSSASAIEGLLSGRPVVVADAGFYAELPDDLVLKVPQQVPAPALAQALEAAAADEPGRRSMGRRARAWAQEAFSLAPYADAVLSLCEAARVARPWLPVASRFGTELARLGFEPEDPVVRRIGAILDGLVRSA